MALKAKSGPARRPARAARPTGAYRPGPGITIFPLKGLGGLGLGVGSMAGVHGGPYVREAL